MSVFDCRGLRHSGQSNEAMAIADAAATDMLRFKGDPIGRCGEALAMDPTAMMPRLLQAHALTFALHPKLLDKARAILEDFDGVELNERERGHIHALNHWHLGEFDRAAEVLGTICDAWPADLMALMFAHQADFFAGGGSALVERPMRALERLPADCMGLGFVKAMAAFGHEEAGRYEIADELVEQALSEDPLDVWAIHARGHILEMQGEDKAGIEWYRRTQAVWSEDCYFACHNWWHLALYHIDRLEFGPALAILDDNMDLDKRSLALNLCDAVSLLWRIKLAGGEIGDRFETVAAYFSRQNAPTHTFNDVHAAIVFAAVGDESALEHLAVRLQTRAEGDNCYGRMARDLGLPALIAFRDFCAGNYAGAIEQFARIMPIEARMTGSRAQREILVLTWIEALLQGGQKLDAKRQIQPRLAAKPNSAKWQADLLRCD